MKDFFLFLIKFVIGRLYFFIKPLFRNRIFTIKHGLAKGLKIRGRPMLMSMFFREDVAGEKFLMDLSFEGKTVYDIGAHIGIYTLFFARAVGLTGTVIAFEPNPDNYYELIENIKINNFQNVVVKRIAVGSDRGEAILWTPVLHTSKGSICEENKQQMLSNYKKIKRFKVEVNSIDYLVERNYKKPDFIKIDVEGAEIDVLQGAKRTLRLYKPKLFIEIHGSDLRKWSDNARTIINFLTDMGYTIYGTESKEILNNSSTYNQIIKSGPIYCF